MGYIVTAVLILMGMLLYRVLDDPCHCPTCEAVFPYYKILLQSDSLFHPKKVCPECKKNLPRFIPVENSEDFQRDRKSVV